MKVEGRLRNDETLLKIIKYLNGEKDNSLNINDRLNSN